MALKRGGGVGGAPPPFANKMIRTAFPWYKHDDDMFFTLGMDGFKKKAGRGGWAWLRARYSPLCIPIGSL